MEMILSRVLFALTSCGVPVIDYCHHELIWRSKVTEFRLNAKCPYLKASNHTLIIGREQVKAVWIDGKPPTLSEGFRINAGPRHSIDIGSEAALIQDNVSTTAIMHIL